MNTTLLAGSNMPVIRSPKLQARISEYLAAKETASEAEKTVKAIKPELIDAMAGAPTAICGPYSLNLTARAGTASSIKLDNGRVIPLSELREVVLRDGTTVKASAIACLTGEREASKVFSVRAR